ncbi:MAG: PIN domain-containing protein [Lutibacter sp.]
MKKNKFLETENVFLDTSIFEEQNFLQSTKIHSLLNYAKIGVVNIHITTISKMELFNRIDKRIAESKTELKKISRDYNYKNTRIIKNLGFYKNIDIPEIDNRKHTNELKSKIDLVFKNANVNTIQTSNIPISEIVKNYYDKKPPFHNSGKQNEFIDAIILKSLELWCKRKNTKMYVMSKDPDFLGYKNDSLIILDNLSVLLENISKYYNQRFKLNRITKTRKIIASEKNSLEQLSKDLIYQKMTLRGKNVDISSFQIEKNKLQSYKILALREDITEVECIFKSSLTFLVFDKNDYRELNPRKASLEIEIPIYVEIKDNRVLDIKWLIENNEHFYEEN